MLRDPRKKSPGPLARVVGLLPRAAGAARDELALLSPKKAFAEAISSLLPRQTFGRTRTALLREAGVAIGTGTLVLGPVRMTGVVPNPCSYLSIGRNSIVMGPLHVDLGAEVRIGDRVHVGHDVSLLTISHSLASSWIRSGKSHASGITIGDGAWIAARVVILPGVTVGAGAAVAAGAVVSRDVPPHTLVAGVPARVIKTLPLDPD